jgi:osmotically-inducible protein OsmY
MLKLVFLSAAIGTGLLAAQQPDNTEKNKRDREGTTTTADKQGNSRGDVDLLAKIRRAITKDSSLGTNAHNVKIVVNDGQVTLRGPVATAAEREQVIATAKLLAGENNVKSYLEVKGEK